MKWDIIVAVMEAKMELKDLGLTPEQLEAVLGALNTLEHKLLEEVKR